MMEQPSAASNSELNVRFSSPLRHPPFDIETILEGRPVVLGGRPASADTQIFKDMLPHGVERSQTQKIADGHACGASATNTFTNAPAFQKCMPARGLALYRIVPDELPTWIDPDTGLECHNAGIAAICGPPKGTTTYVNKHGYPFCRRTGLLSVCTNL